MNLPSWTIRPRVFALLLLGACALRSLPAQAGWQEVNVCNEGSIDVAVAWAQEDRVLVFAPIWDSEGWQWVGAGGCERVWLRTTDTMAIVHLVVAGKAPDGTFGALPARRLQIRDIPNGKSSLCVAYDRFDIGADVLPPCHAPFVEVPTAGSLVVGGPDYRRDITVHPIPSDYASMVAINGPAPAGMAAATPPAAAVRSNDNTGDFWGSLFAAANEELERRQQLQMAPPPPPPLPPAQPALSGQAWVDATRAVISGVNDSCLSAGHRPQYCSCLSEELGFGPDNPHVNGLITNWDDNQAHRLLGGDHTWRGSCDWMGAPSAPPPPADLPTLQPEKTCVADNDDIFKCVRASGT
jgi:hypothetical protein